MEITSLIIAIVSLTWGAFTFWFYDRKTKRQDARINEYTLAKIEAEQTEKKKAQIRANIIKGSESSRRTFKVYNKGEATAYNIRVEFSSEMDGIFFRNEVFPYKQMHKEDHTSINFSLSMGFQRTIDVKLIWDDEFQKDNEHIQTLTV